jgi:hypothetical protein
VTVNLAEPYEIGHVQKAPQALYAESSLSCPSIVAYFVTVSKSFYMHSNYIELYGKY